MWLTQNVDSIPVRDDSKLAKLINEAKAKVKLRTQKEDYERYNRFKIRLELKGFQKQMEKLAEQKAIEENKKKYGNGTKLDFKNIELLLF